MCEVRTTTLRPVGELSVDGGRNGGVRLLIPDGYSAELVTGTVNGGIDIDFPITIQGRLGRRITTSLGDGGPTVRAVATNGGVQIQRR